MSSSDTVTETGTAGDTGRKVVESLSETIAPAVARHARSGNLAAASGAISLVRAGRTFLKGDRKRGALQALAGLFWVGVALAQRRAGGKSDGRGSRSGGEASDVVDTGPDVSEAVDPGERDTDHATGEAVVDTTDADIEESDTAAELDADVDEDDVDQRDVVETGAVEDAAETGADGEAGGVSEGDSDETATENSASVEEGDEGESEDSMTDEDLGTRDETGDGESDEGRTAS